MSGLARIPQGDFLRSQRPSFLLYDKKETNEAYPPHRRLPRCLRSKRSMRPARKLAPLRQPHRTTPHRSLSAQRLRRDRYTDRCSVPFWLAEWKASGSGMSGPAFLIRAGRFDCLERRHRRSRRDRGPPFLCLLYFGEAKESKSAVRTNSGHRPLVSQKSRYKN
jgi:hypothetical protein